MTIGCARCHDHKFDPITQHDYYALYSTFAGVRHGATPLATKEARNQRNARLAPLNAKKQEIEKAQKALQKNLLDRAFERLDEHESRWVRDAVDRRGTEDRFDPVIAKFVRLICEGRDDNPKAKAGFTIDEFEVWSAGKDSRNVALARNGGSATGASRKIEDFPGAYGPHHAIDGKTGARFISASDRLTIELSEPTAIERVLFSSAKGETAFEHRKFVFVGEYRIEVSEDGETWKAVANGLDRKPVGLPPRDSRGEKPNLGPAAENRLRLLETTREDRVEQVRLAKELTSVNREIGRVPAIASVWIGKRVEAEARRPHHVFLGGSPQKRGDEVTPKSLSALDQVVEKYELASDATEADRRLRLADWITHHDNPVTPRVLANRLWHYHFGNGIVDTPSDFGYMGGRPTHPELLDYLAIKLKENEWRIKPIHRLIMLSETYQQSSSYRESAARVDGDARLLWRFPPRRLSAEEIRDTILHISGKLNHSGIGGPGFRLYQFMQDNVCTYVPLDEHGPETYRRAVYHQNARASVVDLMTDFDQPDCAFTAPRRAETTTPLQALTMLNHKFTLDMAEAFAKRLENEASGDSKAKLKLAFEMGYARPPTEEELTSCSDVILRHGWVSFCRAFLNTSELIHVR